MTIVSTDTLRLMLYPLSAGADGDVIAPLELDPARASIIVVGRGSKVDWHIPDRRVSRHHATLTHDQGVWALTDAGSQHGTRVNGRQLAQGASVPIAPGDELAFGPWRCQCERSGGGVPAKQVRLSYDDFATVSSRVSFSRRSDLAGVSQLRLDAVLVASRRLASASCRDDVARVLRDSVGQVTQGARIFVVRPVGDDRIEFLGTKEGEPTPEISHSLVKAVLQSRLVQTLGDIPPGDSSSLMRLDIQSAMCAPLLVAGRVEALLYLDSRGSERRLPDDSLAFCIALADVGGLALERLVAVEHAAVRAQLDRDLKAAHAAQAMLLPPRSGVFSSLRYVFESIPGRYVAGDLFDVVQLPGGRIAFSLGDVSGKGMGAGILMAATQMQFRALLAHGLPLNSALSATNLSLTQCSEDSKFVTLIAGVWDPGTGSLELCDAGHGCILLGEPGQPFAPVVIEGGLPLGVGPGTDYAINALRPARGSRVLLFSDGIIEQTDPRGERFGSDRLAAVVSERRSAGDEVTALIEAVHRHAGGVRIDDDLTAACIELL